MISTLVSWSVPQHAQSDKSLVMSGWFHIRWGDGVSTFSPQTLIKYYLVDDAGNSTALEFDPKSADSDAILSLDRKRVRVAVEQISAPEGVQINVRTIGLEKPSSAVTEKNSQTGNKKWVTILCRFADSTSTTPNAVSFFQGLMSNTAPGMDHYWRETSNGNINIAGSVVVGWYNLPQPRSYYIHGNPARFDFNRAEPDAITLADPDIFFPDFYGINFVFNEELDGLNYGGITFVSKDGLSNQIFGSTDLSPGGYGNQSRVAHEMGHGFGLSHSSGPYSDKYDSDWDPMSSLGVCSPPNPTYGCLGANTIAYHKDKLGWISSARKYLAAPGTTATINIERLGQPASANNYLMAQLPIDDTHFYTVEARLFSGYDNQIPAQALIIHQVDTSRIDRTAQVVDPDNNGDPNDAGARWLPGETFLDEAHGIQVTVNSMGTSSFSVTLANSCAYSVSPLNRSMLPDGGNGSINVTATASCSWMAVSNDAWLNVNSSVTNNGNGVVNYSVLANTGNSSRVGTLLVAGQIFTVTQAAPPTFPPPYLLLDEVSGRAAALDSVMWLRDPFSVVNPSNLSLDQRTRITLFATNALIPGDNTPLFTAQAEDAQHTVYPLVVESAEIVPDFNWLTQITVELPDALAGKGEIQISIIVRGQTSNKVVVRIR